MSHIAEADRITRAGRRLAQVALVGALALVSVGCDSDSWFDQSVVGRWEYTPTVVPILERIDVIEGDQGEFVETTEVTPDDLVPEVRDYRVGPGDILFLEIFDFLQPEQATPLERTVDARGSIDVPQVGRVDVLDLTVEEIKERLKVALREAGIIEDALVSVQLRQRRQATYSVFGSVNGVGRYLVPEPDYRLLEALTEAGGISPAIKKLYVIRQIPLSEDVRHGAGVRPSDPDQPSTGPREETQEGVDLDQLIERLTEEGENGEGGGGSPALMQDQDGSRAARRQQEGEQAERQAPPVDLIESEQGRRPERSRTQTPANGEGDGSWVFLNGEWVRVQRRGGGEGGLPEGEDPLESTQSAEDLVTQRIIEVPTKPLIEGDPRYNIVIQPGDVIRVPSPEQGLVYLAGPGIARPGIYNLPTFGRLTLTKAVLAAGGLNGLAVPWRVDLTRMVGDDRQATIRLDLKAIAEGTQPDIFLKPDDMVNVGTTWWATPLAVIRNGFRASYGFGFLLDRNFGNDVFGAPPTNRQ